MYLRPPPRTVVNFLKDVFASEGVPKYLITDNGVQFVSQEMCGFLKDLGVTHQKTALYTPKANGLAERMNRVVKDCAQRTLESRGSFDSVLRDTWWAHRTTPNVVTLKSPFEDLRGRKACSKLNPCWLPECTSSEQSLVWRRSRVSNYQNRYKARYDLKMGTKVVEWCVGDSVLIKNPRHVFKGKTNFLGPFTIVVVKRNVVRVNTGAWWSMSRLVRYTGGGKDASVAVPCSMDDGSGVEDGSFVSKGRRRNVPIRFRDYELY